MKILVVGSGGREHALGVQLQQSRHQPELYFAPGNPGMAALGQRLEIDPTDIEGLRLFARRESIDLTVVGPELPLSLGIVDAFQAEGLTIFGPPQAGARLEASKAYAKAVMAQAHVPTAGYRFCQTQTEALEALRDFTPPYVIKQDGLAAGKGVTIAPTVAEAEAAIAAAFQANMPVVIEEFLQGEEVSILALCDGQRALPLIAAQDFKKIGEGDTGPNTGGMGAYAPVPWVDDALMACVQREILTPTLQALQAAGIDYRGVLYAGLMVTPEGAPKVIEFNARFGDPETQVVLPLLETDLVDLLLAAAQGDLSPFAQTGIAFQPGQKAVTVVLASQGYPEAFETRQPITFPPSLPQGVRIFHAGTAVTPGQDIVTQGGRVLNVTATAPTWEEARQKAYQVAEAVDFANKYYRRDIAAKVSSSLQEACPS